MFKRLANILYILLYLFLCFALSACHFERPKRESVLCVFTPYLNEGRAADC